MRAPRPEGPEWVNYDRVEPAAGPAMSAVPRKRKSPRMANIRYLRYSAKATGSAKVDDQAEGREPGAA
jgi:hypothetical protein